MYNNIGNTGFTPVSFIKCIDRVRELYPTTREAIKKDMSLEVEKLLVKLGTYGNNITEYISCLNNRKIDTVFFAFLHLLGKESYPDYFEKLKTALTLGFKRRLFELSWVMLQENYGSEARLNAMEFFCYCMQNRFPEAYRSTVFGQLSDWKVNFPEKIYQLLLKKGEGVAQFLVENSISENSNLGRILLNLYFSNCSKDAFEMDIQAFVDFINIEANSEVRVNSEVGVNSVVGANSEVEANNEVGVNSVVRANSKVRANKEVGANSEDMNEIDNDEHENNMLAKAVENYLRVFSIYDYKDEINDLLIKIFGRIDDFNECIGIDNISNIGNKNSSSNSISNCINMDNNGNNLSISGGISLWDKINKEQRISFQRWEHLKEIRNHFGCKDRKIKLWTNFFEMVDKVFRDYKKGLLFMDFVGFVVVDTGFQEDAAYLYSRRSFDLEFEYYLSVEEEHRNWRINTEQAIDARDFNIEGIKSDIYRIGYERVRYLHLKELVNDFLKK